MNITKVVRGIRQESPQEHGMAKRIRIDDTAFDPDLVEVEYDDGIAWVYFNRPEQKNTFCPALNEQMSDLLDELETDERCRILVLSGRGNAFSAGLDVQAYFDRCDTLTMQEMEGVRQDFLDWQRQRLMYFRKPTIAMVNGCCFGAAFTPVISCDIAIAASDATFGLSEINHGTIPGGYVTKAISVKLRQADALYYIMTGTTFSGSKAAEIGLVNAAVPRKRLVAHTTEIARLLMTKDLAAVNAAKLAYKHVRDIPWESADDYLYAKAVHAKVFPSSNHIRPRPGTRGRHLNGENGRKPPYSLRKKASAAKQNGTDARRTRLFVDH
jgi:feruloyl-CoA hydratase/lyase